MSRTFAFAIAGSLLFASAGLADIPRPPGPIPIARVSFQGVENHTDYIFYLRVPPIIHPVRSRTHYLIEVKDSKAFNLDPTRLADIKLLAMDRKEYDKRVKDDPSDNWLTPETKGILSAKVTPLPATAPADVKEAPVTTYNVSIKEGKLTVELVPDAKRSDAAPTGLVPTGVAGLVIALCMAGMGLWLTRRKN